MLTNSERPLVERKNICKICIENTNLRSISCYVQDSTQIHQLLAESPTNILFIACQHRQDTR